MHDCLVESLSSPPLSQAAGKIDFGKSSMSRVFAAAALTLGIFKHERSVDIYSLHVSLGHVHDDILGQTAKKHGIRLTRELISCSACSRGKGQMTRTTNRTTTRAKVHVDTAGPYPVSLGGSRYMMMFVDNVSRLQRPGGARGARGKSASAVFAVVKRFWTAMNAPGAFRTDNVTRSDASSPHHGLPNKTDPLRTLLPGRSRQGIGATGTSQADPGCSPRGNPRPHLSSWDKPMDGGTPRGSECFNWVATSANDGWLSLHEAFHGSRPPLPLLPFFHPNSTARLGSGKRNPGLGCAVL